MKNPRSALIAVFFLPLALTTAHAQSLGREFDLLEQTARVDIVTELCHAMRVTYSLWTLKASRTGLAPERLCANAIARESAIFDPAAEPFEQAKSNLKFMDRMQAIQAAFQDSHLYLAPSVGRARIRMPFTVSEVEGKVIVTTVETPLLKLLSSNSRVTGIDVGDELVTVDSEAVATAISRMTRWIPNSSRLGARQHAVASLVNRAFRFPENPVLKLGIRKMPSATAPGNAAPAARRELEVEIPWVYDSVSRADEREFFFRAGYRDPMGLIKKTWDPKKGPARRGCPNQLGYGEETLAKKLKNPSILFNGNFEIAAIGGVYDEDGKKAAVLQLRTFPSRVMSMSMRSIMGEDFAESVADLVETLQKLNLPFILDLRRNHGGVLNQATEVARAFIPDGTTIPSLSMAMPLTHLNRSMADIVTQPAAYLLNDELPQGAIAELEEKDLGRLLKLAASSNQFLTDAYVMDDLKGFGEADALAKGVAVLIGPDCISACEILVSLLKRSGSGLIIGSETDGTGAGYVMGGAFNGSWKDHYSAFRANFPTFLFGAPGETVGKRIYPGEADARCSEQRPTQADPGLQYAPTLQADIIGGDKGWMSFALAVLQPAVVVKPKP